MHWQDGFVTGVAALDEQHRSLIGCIDDLEAAVAEGRRFLALHAVARLRMCVRAHFATEEHLMRMHRFPGLGEHVNEHRWFATRLFELMMANTRRDNSAEMVGFLSDWLTDHILRLDREFAAYLCGAESGPFALGVAASGAA
jgi:hemerythrin-like metal-binding protein